MRKYRRVNNVFLISFLFFLLCLFSGFDLKADNSGESRITIDWEEFRSLLKLDVDEMRLSWEEFSRLMEQTGAKYEPEYRVDKGEVVLTREEFKKLVNKMKPPTGDGLTPPAEYILARATYNGIMGKESTSFNVLLNLEIFGKDKKTYLKIPLFQESLAISEIKLDGNPASVITQGGWHYLSTDKVGRHLVTIRFSVKSSPDKGSPGLNFSIPQTPITYINLDIPRTNLEVNIQNAQGIRKTEIKNHTIVKGYTSPSSYINISWKKEDKKIRRGPARIYSEVFNLLSIEADAISVTSICELNVMQNMINVLTLTVPQDYQVIDVKGAGLGGWNMREEGERQLLDISFEYSFEGTKVLTIKSEKLLEEETIVADFDGFEVLNAVRESGYVAGEVKSDARAEVGDFENLEMIDFQKIPYQLSNLSARPILFAFKYVRHPYNMVVRITKYEKEEALTSFIDFAKVLTLFTEDGKMVHQVTFTMQNLWDQFLKINLPEDVSVWSVYVNGKREKASKDNDGRILIPLMRSERQADGSLMPFDIEIIYTEALGSFSLLGKKRHSFPTTDILINKVEWNLYLPVNYDYVNFVGDFKPKVQEMILVSEPEMLTDDIPDEDFSEIELKEEAARIPKLAASKKLDDYNVDKERIQFTTGKAGLLSLKVNIPISGKKYSFEKKIVEREEKLFLGFTYANESIKRSLILLFIIILLAFLFKKRRMFLPIYMGMSRSFIKLLDLLTLALRPKEFLVIITVILFLWILTKTYWYYPLFSFVLILFFVVSIVRYVKSRH